MRSRSGAGSCGSSGWYWWRGWLAVHGASAAAADDARELAATIDRLIGVHWNENQVTPAPPADDAEFIRRVALDLAGKIPTAGEVREFLDDPRADKRARLVERLLDSPAYIAHFTNIEKRLLIPEAESSAAGAVPRAFVPGLAPRADRRERRQRQDRPCDPDGAGRR